MSSLRNPAWFETEAGAPSNYRLGVSPAWQLGGGWRALPPLRTQALQRQVILSMLL